MADPNSTAALALPITAVGAATAAGAISSYVGPVAAEYLLILMGGLFGALFALSSQPQPTSRTTIFYVIRAIGASLIFTSAVSIVLAPLTKVDIGILWMPISGVISMYAHRFHELGAESLRRVVDIGIDWLRRITGGSK